jgi:hypothetical protein
VGCYGSLEHGYVADTTITPLLGKHLARGRQVYSGSVVEVEQRIRFLAASGIDMAEKFKIDNVVRLKSGRPAITVVDVAPYD